MRYFFILFCLIPLFALSQKIGADVLDFTPKTTTQMNAMTNPPLGRVLYNSTTNSVWQYNGTQWVEVGSASQSQSLSLIGTDLSISDSNSVSFAGWDTNAADDVNLTGSQNVTGLKTFNSIKIDHTIGGAAIRSFLDIRKEPNGLNLLPSNNAFARIHFSTFGSMGVSTATDGSQGWTLDASTLTSYKTYILPNGVSGNQTILTDQSNLSGLPGIGTPDDNSVTSSKIVDGTIQPIDLNAGINASLALADNALSMSPMGATFVRPIAGSTLTFGDASGRNYMQIESNAVAQAEGTFKLGENLTFFEDAVSTINEIPLNFDFVDNTDRTLLFTPNDIAYAGTNILTEISNINTVTSEPLSFIGSVVGSGTLGSADITLTIPDNNVTGLQLKATGLPANENVAIYNNSTEGFDWITRPITVHPNSDANIKFITLETKAAIEAAAYDNTVLAIPTDEVERDYVQIALSDLTSDLTAGTLKGYWTAPADGSFDTTANGGIWIKLRVPGTGTGVNVDINKNGVDIATTNLTTDTTESSSLTAATSYALSSTTFVKGDEFTFDFDAVPTGAKTALITLTIIYND